MDTRDPPDKPAPLRVVKPPVSDTPPDTPDTAEDQWEGSHEDVGATGVAAELALMVNPANNARATLAASRAGNMQDGDLLAIVDSIEHMMVAGYRESHIRQATGLRTGRVRRYMGLVRQRWGREGRTADRAARRDAHRATVSEVFQRAMARTRAVPVGIGPGLHRLEHVPDPDLRSALDARRLLAQLDGDLEQPNVDGGAVNVNILQHIHQALGLTDAIDAEPPKGDK